MGVKVETWQLSLALILAALLVLNLTLSAPVSFFLSAGPPASEGRIDTDRHNALVKELLDAKREVLETKTAVQRLELRIRRQASLILRGDGATRTNSTPHSNNSSDSSGSSADNLGLVAEKGPLIPDCQVIKPPTTVTWRAKPGRYLLCVCNFMRLSNRLRCLKYTMLYAAMLDRTLLFPQIDLTGNYDYRLIFDVAHARQCLSANDTQAPPAVLSLEEYLSSHEGKLAVKKVRCWGTSWATGCRGFDHTSFQSKYPGVTLPHTSEWAASSPLTDTKELTVREFLDHFTVEDEVLVMGDTFYTVLTDLPNFDHSPISHPNCDALLQPHSAIVEAAMGFVRTYLGPSYVAMHWRRGDFYNYCDSASKDCFHPATDVARCMRPRIAASGTDVIYLATDAAEQEVKVFHSILTSPDEAGAHTRGGERGLPITLVRLPPNDSFLVERWALGLSRLDIAANNNLWVVRLTLDQIISSNAKVFFRTVNSTFSARINDLRWTMGRRHCLDDLICH